jgi:hypothetical protein
MSAESIEVARVRKVLENMQRMLKDDPSYAEPFAEILESGLTALHEEGCFGTEGQCDPRGDFREGPWSMERVQDID